MDWRLIVGVEVPRAVGDCAVDADGWLEGGIVEDVVCGLFRLPWVLVYLV